MVTTLMVAAFIIAGCGKSNDALPPRHPVPPGTATIRGKVLFDGVAPERKVISVAEHCNGAPDILDETVVVNPNDTLKNVIVYLKDGPPGDGGGPTVILDQKGCHYIPHVVALQVEQPFIIRNSDPVMHNVHIIAGVNGEQSAGMNGAGDYKPPVFKAPEFFPIKCDVHPWMDAEIAVFDHPYFAVTGDDGSFEIKNIPAGNYTLTARHERYGEQSQPVTVTDKKTSEATFTYKQP